MTNLSNKKALAAKALKVGKNRIILSNEAIEEIKQAITKQDIKDLAREGIIRIKPVKGRKKIKRRKIRRGAGKIKKKVRKRKQEYAKVTRKLRKYLMELYGKGLINREFYRDLRKKIKMRVFRSIASFKEYLKSIKIEAENVKQIKSKEGGDAGESEKVDRQSRRQDYKEKEDNKKSESKSKKR